MKIKDKKLKINEIEIIETILHSTMASTFTEYLCLEKINNNQFRLFVGGYEVIGEASDYYNEEDDEENIPEQIDGQTVQGVEDGCIIGGSILQNEDDGEVIFSSTTDKDLKEWLERVSYYNTKIIEKLKKLEIK